MLIHPHSSRRYFDFSLIANGLAGEITEGNASERCFCSEQDVLESVIKKQGGKMLSVNSGQEPEHHLGNFLPNSSWLTQVSGGVLDLLASAECISCYQVVFSS